jgi:LacI family transcriptional regulator, galactose operon repressor
MSVTLREVAARSQVSVSTASRALNGRGEISKEVRERVLSAAHELQYAANQNARALKSATTKIIGVVLYDAGASTFNAPLMQGVYDAATPRGYSVIVCDAAGSATAEEQALQALLERQVDGILINSAAAPNQLRRLHAAGMPFVVINRRVEEASGLEADYVLVDAERGCYLGTRHLLEQGHTRIVYHGLEPTSVPTLERLPGYRRALGEFGIPFAPELVMHSASSSLADTHLAVTSTMQRLSPRPTAILAFNDTFAVAILKGLHDLGLRVPEDVAVVGQNNLEFTEFLCPPLTTVAHPVQQMGRQGTQLLLQKLAWPDHQMWLPHRVALEPVLVVRDSSRRPSRAGQKRSLRLAASAQ